VGFFRKNVANANGRFATAGGTVTHLDEIATAEPPMQGAQRSYAEQVHAMEAKKAIHPDDPRLRPIAGVSLADYAAISKAAAVQGVDAMGLVRLALFRGVVASEAAWHEAQHGWNARMKGDTQLATQFGYLYQAAAG
jgi:hypothetical protein